jgi:hypothetical protein
MIVRYRVLAERIELELALLGEVVQRCEDAMERAVQNVADRDFYVAAAALNLHDFYNGLERLFEIVAAEIDETVPRGSSWHRDLLTQMTIPLRDVRPPVLTRETAQYLDQYLRFCHLVRHAYSLHLDAKRVGTLVADMRMAYDRASEEMEAFVHFLERLSRADEGDEGHS